MNRLDNLKNLQRPIFKCYLPVGDPMSLPNQAQIYADEGADIFEVGIPTANPFMDGELIANSMSRILAAGITEGELAQKVRQLSEQHASIAMVVMGYLDISFDALVPNSEASFDGFLQVGVESYDKPTLDNLGVHGIQFIAQDRFTESLPQAKAASGYIFLQASAGKTGLRESFDMTNKDRIKILRDCGVDIPILLGIGISNAEHAKLAIECGADGIVIGSACVAKAAEGEAELRAFLKSVRSALDAAG